MDFHIHVQVPCTAMLTGLTRLLRNCSGLNALTASISLSGTEELMDHEQSYPSLPNAQPRLIRHSSVRSSCSGTGHTRNYMYSQGNEIEVNQWDEQRILCMEEVNRLLGFEDE